MQSVPITPIPIKDHHTRDGSPAIFALWYSHPPIGSPTNRAIAIGRNAYPWNNPCCPGGAISEIYS